MLCLWQAGAPVLGDGSHLVNPAVKRVVVEPSAVNQALHAQVRSICWASSTKHLTGDKLHSFEPFLVACVHIHFVLVSALTTLYLHLQGHMVPGTASTTTAPVVTTQTTTVHTTKTPIHTTKTPSTAGQQVCF